MAKGISGIKIPKVGPNPIGIGSPKNKKLVQKSQTETAFNFQLQNGFEFHLVNDYQQIKESLPVSFTIEWNKRYFPDDIINAYNQLLTLTKELLHAINLIRFEHLDAIFIITRMEDPNDKDLDILVNKMKHLIDKREKELQTILKSLENDYLDANKIVNPTLFRSKQQVRNPINRALKEINEEITALVTIFAQAQK